MSEWDQFQRVDQPQSDAGWDLFKRADAPAAPMSVTDRGIDALKGLGTGVARGAAYLLGQGGDINKLADAGLKKMEGLGLPDRQAMVEGMPQFLGKYHEKPAPDLGSSEIMKWADKTAGIPLTSYDPQTFVGKAARTVGEFAPAAALTRTGFVGGALLPGVASETAGKLTEGTKAEPYARVGGAVAGGLAPSLLSRAVTPFPSTPTRQQAVNVLEQEGVNALTAGQRVGNKGLQYLEDARGSAAAQGMMQRQGEQFTSAVMRRAGVNAERATPEVVDDAFTRIGQEIEYVANRNVAQFDRALAGELGQALRGYNNIVAPPNRVPAVENFITEVSNAAITNGSLPGPVYQSLRSRMAAQERAMRFNNSEAATAIREMREALDDAMERSLRRAGRIDDLESWRQARREYRNMLSIEGAAAKADASEGLLSPQAMRTALTSTKGGKRDYARGRGDFADLVHAANTTMTPLPNSGTAQRNLAQNMGAGIPAILGGYGGSQAGGAEGAAMGALAGFMAPRLAGRAMMSGPGQAYLSNQLMAPAQNPTAAAQLFRALLAAQQAQALPQR
jgi:hypothetical protein